MTGAQLTRRRPGPAVALFVAAAAGTGVLLTVWFSDLTFWRDEWAFLLHRRGSSPDVFLEPHYEHIAVSLIAVYKALLGLFGMDSPRPFQIAATATFLLSIGLMFVYVRRRVGDWLALAAALPILVLGPAWDDLLWPFQLGFFASMSSGLGALMLLAPRDRIGDVAAAVLLVVSVSFSSLGLPFAVAAAVHVGWDRDRLRRAWVVAVPVAAYLAWWLGWGRDADSYVSLHNLVTLPSYVLDGLASSITSWIGLAPREGALDWGRALLVVAVALAAWRVRLNGAVTRDLCVVLALALAFWAAAGLNASIFREPTSGRYQYMGAVFIVLIAAELLRGSRLPRSATLATVAVAVLAAMANAGLLQDSYSGLTGFGRLQPANLAAIELTRDVVAPDFELTEQNSGVDYLGEVDAGSYLAAVDEFGSPAYTEAELAAAPEDARAAADRVFAAALALRLEPQPGPRSSSDSCTRLGAGGADTVDLGPGGAVLEAVGSRPELRLRRYATDLLPVSLGAVPAPGSALLSIPRDLSPQPWQLAVAGPGSVDVCGLEGP